MYDRKINIPLYVGIAFLACLIFIEFVSIMMLNSGLLVYTLDDAYIHLALAENIKQGHYGINISEFSAPSSSALWPFILAPFSSYPYSAFYINAVSAIASVIVLVKILHLSINITDDRTRNIFVSVITILFILATNVVGLVFTGMEHSLQLLTVLLIAYGLFIENKEDKIEWWLLAAIIVAPLIRYECMAISFAAIFYLVMHRYFKPAGITLLFLAVFLGGFSIFLTSLGLDAFPNSVIAKSSVVQSGGALGGFVSNLMGSLNNRQGVILFVGVLVLLFYVFWGKDDIKRKSLAVVTIFAVFLHFIAGRYGWYHRYEIYVLAFEVVVILYLFLPLITKDLFGSNKTNFNLFTAISFAGVVAVVVGAPYIHALFSIPIASNNIYEQQYQMHRFVVDYYKKPVAVNDLGYVSYKNSNYVLDLWGLGSQKALRSRINSGNANWMQDLIDEANVSLVMIYDDWFNNIPDEWIKIGELLLGKKRITPARSTVSFYSTNKDAYQEILSKMILFSKTLPSDVKFKFEDKITANKALHSDGNSAALHCCR